MKYQLIKEKIYLIKNQHVMLDFDLANLLGYGTKTFNQTIKRNTDKFLPDSISCLSKEELLESLNDVDRRSQIVTTFQRLKYRNSKLYIFNETAIKHLKMIFTQKDKISVIEDILEVFRSLNYKNDLFELETQSVSDINLSNMIHIIRGEKVMLDYDLAKIYGYDVKAFNQQVKNNIEKFPNDFTFMISKDELDIILKSKKLTSSLNSNVIDNAKASWGGRRTLPYAFTEQGIYMLMTVLKGELATKQSIRLIKLFKSMKDYIVQADKLTNANELIRLTRQVDENTKSVRIIESKLEIVMDNFIDPSTYKHFLLLDGKRIEADVVFQKIYALANKTILIIDDYIDIKTLELLKSCKNNIRITICTDNLARNNLTTEFINDFEKDTGLKLSFISNNKKFHDRYILLDFNNPSEALFNCGPSSKDAGKKIGSISKIDDIEIYRSTFNKLLTMNN